MGGNDTIILGADTRSGGDDSVVGGFGNDYIRAGADEPSFLFGNQGNDTITQFPGQVDTLVPGGDTVLAVVNTAQPDSLWGGQGNDYLLGTAGAGLVAIGDVGNDTVVNLGSNTSNFILAGDVDPTAIASNSADYIQTGGGNQHFVFGNVGNDTIDISYKIDNSTILGGQNDDRISATGTAAGQTNLNNFASGDRGSDYIFGAFGNSTLYGDNEVINDGNDTIILQGAGTDVTGNLLNGDPATQDGTDIDTVTSGDDTIISPTGGGDDVLVAMGASGNTLLGGAGDDSLVSMPSMGTVGNRLDGGAGNDTYIFSAEDTVIRDTLGDNVYIGQPGAQNVVVTIGPNDRFSGQGQFFITGDQNNFIEAGTAGVITGNGFDRIVQDNVVGTTNTNGGDDVLDLGNVGAGGTAGNVLAGSGNDSIDVENGIFSGSVLGEAGNDTINVGGSGVDAMGAIDGGNGNDSITANMVSGSVAGGAGMDTLNLSTLNSGAVVSAGADTDVLNITAITGGNVLVDGGAGNERIVPQVLGTTNADMAITLRGGDGDDTLAFPTGPDIGGLGGNPSTGTATPALFLDGGAGNDFLQGRPFGIDTLIGGAGNDTFYGGASNFSGIAAQLMGTNVLTAFDSLDGDILDLRGGGNDVVQLPSIVQTSIFVAASFGTNPGTRAAGLESQLPANFLFDSGTSPLTGSTNAAVGTVTYAPNVDTLLGFDPSDDTIVLGSSLPGVLGLPGLGFSDVFMIGSFNSSVNVFEGSGVLAGKLGDGARRIGTVVAGANSFVGQRGTVSYDRSTGGLYLGLTGFGPDQGQLIAVLPTGLDFTGVDANSFLDIQDFAVSDGFSVI